MSCGESSNLLLVMWKKTAASEGGREEERGQAGWAWEGSYLISYLQPSSCRQPLRPADKGPTFCSCPQCRAPGCWSDVTDAGGNGDHKVGHSSCLAQAEWTHSDCPSQETEQCSATKTTLIFDAFYKICLTLVPQLHSVWLFGNIWF